MATSEPGSPRVSPCSKVDWRAFATVCRSDCFPASSASASRTWRGEKKHRLSDFVSRFNLKSTGNLYAS